MDNSIFFKFFSNFLKLCNSLVIIKAYFNKWMIQQREYSQYFITLILIKSIKILNQYIVFLKLV